MTAPWIYAFSAILAASGSANETDEDGKVVSESNHSFSRIESTA